MNVAEREAAEGAEEEAQGNSGCKPVGPLKEARWLYLQIPIRCFFRSEDKMPHRTQLVLHRIHRGVQYSQTSYFPPV